MLKYTLTTALAAGLIVTSSMAQAFDVRGGDLNAMYATEQGGGSAQYALNGSLDMSVTDHFGVQIDGAAWTYEGVGIPTLWGVAVHGYYSITPAWDIGLYVAYEDWKPQTMFRYGLEAAYHDGPWSLDATAARDEYQIGGAGTVVDVSGAYAFNQESDGVSLLGGARYEAWPGNDFVAVTLGVRYAFASGPYIEARYIHEDFTIGTDDIFALNFGFEFGAGATFNARLAPSMRSGN